MLRHLCTAKIYNAVVTEACVEYEGSLGVDRSILEVAGLVPYEQVLVVNTGNASRFQTYVIPEEANSGTVALYGGAARLGKPGDRLILMSFAALSEEERAGYPGPRVIRLQEGNRLPPREA